MKNQIVFERWNGTLGVYELTISNKWGVFSAKTICSKEDWDVISCWTGARLCEYKILIQTLKAKAKAFEQRAIGIEHAYYVLSRTQQQCDSSGSHYGDVLAENTGLDLLCCMDNVRKEARDIRNKAKELAKNYPAYAEYLLSSKRKLSQLKF